ncbi:MAG: D-aminoacyl-tRNA deacylase [Balneolaceae bacterium]
MKVVVQRVSRAQVTVNERITGEIKNGLLLLVGIHEEDRDEILEWVCNKILKLRIFEDEEGKMNLSVGDIDGEILVVSQFTLYGDIEKGNRPSFVKAAKPDKAEKIYDQMIEYFKRKMNKSVQSGVFGAMMDVELTNKGPVTILVERE